ncbi:MAG: Eco29kI family restriction endonuclease [Pyrinomonadaceae bacterium]
MAIPIDNTDSDPHKFEFDHHFDFDLDRAISAQVVEKLESSPLLALEKNSGPKLSGIYALYFKGKLVYVGKASKGTTKSERTLRERLNEHVTKIAGRQNIKLSQMRCRFLTFESEWWVFAAEFALMVHYEPEWNTSGFGSKTPGKGRPGTHRVSRWNAQFPPKLP